MLKTRTLILLLTNRFLAVLIISEQSHRRLSLALTNKFPSARHNCIQALDLYFMQFRLLVSLHCIAFQSQTLADIRYAYVAR